MNLFSLLSKRESDPAAEFGQPVESDSPAWLASLAVHLLALVVLAMWWTEGPARPMMLTIESEQLSPQELSPEHFEYAPDVQEEIGSQSEAGTGVAMAVAPNLSDIAQVAPEGIAAPDLAAVHVPALADVSTAATLSENVPVKGAVGVGATGATGAVDRITEEILRSLEQRPTLVVWLFDKTLSMQPQRQAIAARFDRIYRELTEIGASRPASPDTQTVKPLLTAVMSFGGSAKSLLDQPTDDLSAIQAAVRSIDEDTDFEGVENVFAAIRRAAQQHLSYRTAAVHRNVMIVAVTDEAGDDLDQLEPTLKVCLRCEMPIYVIGVPAPFGRRDVLVRYVDPDPNFNQSEKWLPVNQGPESVFPEAINVSFAGSRDDGWTRMDSGFGPYGLSRVCYETGGIYFAVHANRGLVEQPVNRADVPVMGAHLTRFFDPRVMRNYRPEYVSLKEYQRLLKDNRARLALVEAAAQAELQPMQQPRLEFPKSDEAGLKRILDEAQRDAAILEPKIDQLHMVLAAGEKERSRLSQPRWQAGYDLALGRVLALKVRTKGYNAMLAKAEGGLKFQKPESDTFMLVPSDEVSVGSALENLAQEARTLLRRVIEDHPRTPWSWLAERELRQPLGWKWSEKRVNYPPPPPAANGNGNPAPAPPPPPLVLPKPKPERPNIRL